MTIDCWRLWASGGVASNPVEPQPNGHELFLESANLTEMFLAPRRIALLFAAILICVAHTNAFSPLRHAKAAWTKIVSPKALDMKETLQSIATTDVFGGMKGFGCGLTGYGCRRAARYAPTSSSGMFRRNLMEQRILAESQNSTNGLQLNQYRVLSSTCNGVGIVVSTETTSFECNGTAVRKATRY